MQIDLWTDIICPWCGLGHHRLELALARFPHKESVNVVYHSFQLDERAPVGVAEDVREMLHTKKGMPYAQIDQVTRHIEQLAAAEGLAPYIVGANRVGNTSMAHELAMWATGEGRGKQMWERLYRAYFAEGRSIFDEDSLVALAVELGLDAGAAREVLTSRKFAKAVYKDGVAASQLGATGVPFYVVDNKFGIAGAQPVDALLGVLERAWRERE